MRGPWAKVNWAASHLQALDKKCRGGIPGFHPDWAHVYPISAETHREGLEYRFYVDPAPLDADEIALMAGDVLFNLRAALDQLVYELHVHHYRGRPNVPPRSRSAFPIIDIRPNGRNGRAADPARWREIADLSARHRRAIVFLQPYNRRNDKYRRIRRDLDALNTLNNIDKHRHLHVVEASTVVAPVGRYADPPLYGFEQESFFGVPLVDKTEVFRWTFDTVPPDVTDEIQKNREITATVFLNEEETGERTILIPFLERLERSVSEVLKRFEVFLPY
jgi:hypothetical protein